MSAISIQERDFTDGRCFGCGPANPLGLRIRSFETEDGTIRARFEPKPEHGNGGGAVCGGILGTALDCHAAAAALATLGRFAVTRDFTIEFVRGAPMAPLELVARVIERRERSVAVEAEAHADGEVCTRFRGVFVVPREAASPDS